MMVDTLLMVIVDLVDDCKWLIVVNGWLMLINWIVESWAIGIRKLVWLTRCFMMADKLCMVL